MVGGALSEGKGNFLQKDSTGRKFVVRIQGFAAEKCRLDLKVNETHGNEKSFLKVDKANFSVS
jgi:hypothetical protein